MIESLMLNTPGIELNWPLSLAFHHLYPWPPSDRKQTMKAFIEANFKMVDLNGDGIISGEEFRYNCITRIAVDDIKVVDEAFNRLMNVSQDQVIHRTRVCRSTGDIPW